MLLFGVLLTLVVLAFVPTANVTSAHHKVRNFFSNLGK